ncbi:MAG: fimbrillin family protein [Rikenellaceae bacterium]
MKKLLLFSLSASLFALSSCEKGEDILPPYDSEITFTSSINSAATKVTGNSFDTGDLISVYANDGSVYSAENVQYEYTGSVFTSSTPIGATGDALSFVAVYPYSEDMAIETTFAALEDQSTEAAYEASDLLSAVTAATTESCPELTFDHSLSAVEVTVNSESTLTAIKINAAVEASCDFAAGEFTATGSTVSVTPFALSQSSYIAVVAPQTISAGSSFLEVEIDGQTYSWNISEDIELLSTYKYLCEVTVTAEGVIFSGVIVPWEDGGNIDIGETDEGGSSDEIPDGYTGIYTAEDLIAINSSDASLQGTYYLANDIDLKGNSDNPWTPIGANKAQFEGIFDGGGHTISGLYIESSSNYAGLFGYIMDAQVVNLNVEGTIISDGDYVGAIVGCNDYSLVMNCSSTVDVTGYSYVGGIVGDNYGSEVINCFNRGDVTATDYCVGGIVSNSYDSKIVNCYNSGDLDSDYGTIGGIVGCNYASGVINCYNSGNISIADSYGYEYGGIAGYNGTAEDIANCYSLSGCIGSGADGVNGTVMESSAMIADNFVSTLNYNANNYNSESPENSACGWVAVSSGYPTLAFDSSPAGGAEPEPDAGSGTLESPYSISSVADLTQLADDVNGGNNLLGIYYKLTTDINLNGSTSNPWTPIGNKDAKFSGNFDGDGHTISGIYVYSSDDNVGLFGYTDKASISNLSISGTITSSGDYVGGLVGCADESMISNCHNSATVTAYDCAGGLLGATNVSTEIWNCSNSGTISANDYYAGGIVGLNVACTLSSCYNTGKVYSLYGYTGGIAGRNYDATVTNCYNTAIISTDGSRCGGIVGGNNYAGKVSNCYNIAFVSAEEGKLGAIVGYNSATMDAEVTNCYSKDGCVIGDSTGEDGTIKSSSDMQNSTEFVSLLNGSQSSTPWVYDTNSTNSGYPILSWM